MVRKKARLSDNNPLESKTDSILNSFSSQQSDNLTSQQVNKLTSKKANNSTSQKVNNLAGKEVSDSEGQVIEKAESKDVHKLRNKSTKSVENQETDKSTSQQAKNLTSKEVNKSVQLKKATYKLSEDIIDRLDRVYLQMQLARGKKNVPFKEVIVEEAIDRFLTQLEDNFDLIEEVIKRQEETRN